MMVFCSIFQDHHHHKSSNENNDVRGSAKRKKRKHLKDEWRKQLADQLRQQQQNQQQQQQQQQQKLHFINGKIHLFRFKNYVLFNACKRVWLPWINTMHGVNWNQGVVDNKFVWLACQPGFDSQRQHWQKQWGGILRWIFLLGRSLDILEKSLHEIESTANFQ